MYVVTCSLQAFVNCVHQPRDQARSLHLSHHLANVQDTCSKRPHIGLFSISVVPGRRQVFRRPGYPARNFVGYLFPLHISVETAEDSVQRATFAQHFQLVHNLYRFNAVCGAFQLPLLPRSASNVGRSQVSTYSGVL